MGSGIEIISSPKVNLYWSMPFRVVSVSGQWLPKACTWPLKLGYVEIKPTRSIWKRLLDREKRCNRNFVSFAGTLHKRKLYNLRVCMYVHEQSLSPVCLFLTPQIVARQAPVSMGLSQQECWRELPFPSPGDLTDPGIEFMFPASPVLQVDSLPLSH